MSIARLIEHVRFDAVNGDLTRCAPDVVAVCDEATEARRERDEQMAAMAAVEALVREVVNERRARINHARETNAMVRLAKWIDGVDVRLRARGPV